MTENSKDRRAQILALGHAIGAFAVEEYDAALQHLENACFDKTDDMYQQTCRLKYIVYRKLDKKEEAVSILHELSVLADQNPENRYWNVFFARDVCNEFNDADLAAELIEDFKPDQPYYQEEILGVQYLINRLRYGSTWEDDLRFLAKARVLTDTVDSVIRRLIQSLTSRDQAILLISELESKANRASEENLDTWKNRITMATNRLAELP